MTSGHGLRFCFDYVATANGGAKDAIVKAFDTVLNSFHAISANDLIKKAHHYVELLAERAAPIVPLIACVDEKQVVAHLRKVRFA